MSRPLPDKAIIGMVHLPALPGSPRHSECMAAIIEQSLRDARALVEGGMDAIMVENMHDRPYLNGTVPAASLAAISIACHELRRADFIPQSMPLGLQVLAGANEAALAVALAADFDFIRAEGFVFSHIADEGLMNACAGDLLRQRRNLRADHIRIFADIKKKHSAHAITADVDIAETARAAEFFLADGVIVTGMRTGHAADPADLAAVKQATKLPMLVGSGVTKANISDCLKVADAVIVGSSIKHGGDWENEVCAASVADLCRAAGKLIRIQC